MRQICEYCRSRVDLLREECKNCGAPVPKFDPAYNTYGSPYFAPNLMQIAAGAQYAQNMGYPGWLDQYSGLGLGNMMHRYGSGNMGSMLGNIGPGMIQYSYAHPLENSFFRGMFGNLI